MFALQRVADRPAVRPASSRKHPGRRLCWRPGCAPRPRASSARLVRVPRPRVAAGRTGCAPCQRLVRLPRDSAAFRVITPGSRVHPIRVRPPVRARPTAGRRTDLPIGVIMPWPNRTTAKTMCPASSGRSRTRSATCGKRKTISTSMRAKSAMKSGDGLKRRTNGGGKASKIFAPKSVTKRTISVSAIADAADCVKFSACAAAER